MSLLDKNILNYYLKYTLSFRIWIYDEKGNKLGRFSLSGYSNKLLDSDKSVILDAKRTGLKKILWLNDRKIYDSSENLIGSISIPGDTDKSIVVSLKDKNSNEVLCGKFLKEENAICIYDNHQNVIAQITITKGMFTQKWNLHVLEPSYDRALLLCLFCVTFYETKMMSAASGSGGGGG